MNTPELLTCQEVLHLTGIRSRTTIWRRIQTGQFPSPVDLGAGRNRLDFLQRGAQMAEDGCGDVIGFGQAFLDLFFVLAQPADI